MNTLDTLCCGRFRLPLSRVLVMGVINITPDSFSDGGRYNSLTRAVTHAQALIQAGADLLDIGGESTRPGAGSVPVDIEIARVIPVLSALYGLDIPLSIDTSKPQVMRLALEHGVDLVNDITALTDPEALDTLVKSNAGVCLMHKQGHPQAMQAAPFYHEVVKEVTTYLAVRRDAVIAAGIGHERILLDPGFGFGKTFEHNVALFQALPRIQADLASPVLVGVSRKSMLGEITGRSIDQRMPASITAAVLAAQAGVAVIRVHDVAETVDALRIAHRLSPRPSTGLL